MEDRKTGPPNWEPRYPSETETPRLSQSSVETYLRCGLWWLYNRESRTRWTTPRMAVGTGVAAGAHADCVVKQDEDRPLPEPQIVEIAVEAYDHEIKTSEVPGSKLEIARGTDLCAGAARAYAQRVSPGLKGVRVSERAIVARIGNLELAMRPDYITADGLGDLKTGQPWTQDRADGSRQLTAYGLGHKAHLGEYPRRVWIDSVYRLPNKRWTAERLWSYRTPTDYASYWEILQRVLSGISEGIALPAPEAAWWCSQKWCPHWRRCPAVAGRRSRNE